MNPLIIKNDLHANLTYALNFLEVADEFLQLKIVLSNSSKSFKKKVKESKSKIIQKGYGIFPVRYTNFHDTKDEMKF